MSYRTVVGRSAERSLRRRIPPERAEQVRGATNGLAEDRSPRVGDYRVLHEVDDEREEVFVAEVWHRQRAYR